LERSSFHCSYCPTEDTVLNAGEENLIFNSSSSEIDDCRSSSSEMINVMVDTSDMYNGKGRYLMEVEDVLLGYLTKDD
jgi:hypothetical protein